MYQTDRSTDHQTDRGLIGKLNFRYLVNYNLLVKIWLIFEHDSSLWHLKIKQKRWEFIKENTLSTEKAIKKKKERKHALEQESKQEKKNDNGQEKERKKTRSRPRKRPRIFFSKLFFSWSFSWACFFSFLSYFPFFLL